VEIAENQRVDAVWPGWGHASENPRLPSTLKEKGIQVQIFVCIYILIFMYMYVHSCIFPNSQGIRNLDKHLYSCILQYVHTHVFIYIHIYIYM
jgi:hypothetical protein